MWPLHALQADPMSMGPIFLRKIVLSFILKAYSPRMLGDVHVICHVMTVKMMVGIILEGIRPTPRS